MVFFFFSKIFTGCVISSLPLSSFLSLMEISASHSLALKTPMMSSAFATKSKCLKKFFKMPHDLAPYYLASFISGHCFSYLVFSNLQSTQFCICIRLSLGSMKMHKYFFLPRMFFFCVLFWQQLSIIKNWYRCHLLQRGFPDIRPKPRFGS